ncbi:MAG: DpnD/PcfM family protein [Acholeplasmatales bacterium]|nr:DpnD/PcfM family protein [Acholeplasmatales bacterium]
MNKYKVEITEYLQRVIEVDAESEEDAIAMVKEDYRKENIVLDDFDLTGLDIEIYNPNKFNK